MCGIVGVLNLDGKPQDESEIAALTQLLSHRGPDGSGVALLHGIGIGHRRLSIIDLEGGTQPMYSADGNSIISFNGEIFNYRDLKFELLSRGVAFRTNSDTEVILEGVRKFGTDFFARLDGQFAVAIYNLEKHELYLARDRFGEKPLFWGKFGSNIVFGSELKVVRSWMKLHDIQPELDVDSFSRFVSLNYVPFHKSMIRDVQEVLPGYSLTLSKDRIAEVPYPRFEAESTKSIGVNWDSVFNHAISRRSVSDVPVGIFLSGGLDSTALAIASTQNGIKPKAFIAHFSEDSFSEATKAVSVAMNLSMPYTVVDVRVDPNSLGDLIQSLVYHGDTPLADSSSLPLYLLSKETAKSVKVVISGDGGDELFGGYLTYRATSIAQRIPKSLRMMLANENAWKFLPTSEQKVGFSEKLERFLRYLSLPPCEAHFAWNGMFSLREKAHILHPDLISKVTTLNSFTEMAEFTGIQEKHLTRELLQEADKITYLPSDILQKVDRMSMAHGLEVRPIYLDAGIAEYAKNNCGRVPKQTLKSYIRHHAPWYEFGRKEGFSIPVHQWFRTHLMDFFHDLLDSELKISPLYNEGGVRKLWQDHLQKRRNVGFELWGVMVGLLWHKRVFRGEV